MDVFIMIMFPCFIWFIYLLYLLFFRILWIESKKNRIFYEIEIFCDNINIFPVIFEQFKSCMS